MLLHDVLHIDILQEDLIFVLYLYLNHIQVQFLLQMKNQYQLKIIVLILYLEKIFQVNLDFPMFDELIDELMNENTWILQILIYLWNFHDI